MKKLLLTIITAVTVLQCYGQINLGYADQMTSGWGDRNSVITPYISFSKAKMEVYKGNEIVAVNIGVMEDASNCYLYFKKNANDNENIYRQKLDDLKSGWNEIILDTPLTITGDTELAIGYKGSFSNAKGVGISNENFTEGDIVYYNSNNSWTTTGGSICINAVISGDNLPENEIGIFKLLEDKSLATEYSHSYNSYVKNLGNNSINNCEIGVFLDEEIIETIQLENIEKNERKNFSFTVSSDVPGNHNVKLNVISVNGDMDVYPYNNTLSTTFNVLDSRFISNVVCEEYTGLWCGWCPRGIEGLEMMKKKYPGRFLAVSIHMNDKLEIDPESDYNYKEEFDKVAGAPYCILNRKYGGDPYMDIENLFNLSTSSSTHLTISANATVNADNTITVNGEILADTDLNNCEYNIAFPVTEDGITGYAQTNYYSGVDYEFYGWEKKDNPTRDIVFNDVARAIIGGAYGMPLFKGNLTAYEPYNFEYTFSIPSEVNDKRKINVIAQLIDPASSFIVNATGVQLDYSGIAAIEALDEINLIIRNGEITLVNSGTSTSALSIYDITGKLIQRGQLIDEYTANLGEGLYIVKTVNSLGSTQSWKVKITK